MLIIINGSVPKEQEERIRALSPKLELAHVPLAATEIPKDLLARAEIIYTSSANFEPSDAPRLRWVQVDTAAINHFMKKPIAHSKIPMANVRGAYTVPVAECAFAMLLAVTRRITTGCNFQSRKSWPDDYIPFQGVNLRGKTMGIVGYGSIGREIARLAQAFGMNILACKRNPSDRKETGYRVPKTGDPEGAIPQAWFGIEKVREMFARSDVAMITLPFTPATKGLIGRKELEALPSHAFVVNVGRGHVVDEAALAHLLKSDKLAGAAFDVFGNEPLEPESPLWNLPNILIMPHIASWTNLQASSASEVFIENLSRDLRGEPLLNVVNKELAY